MTNVTRLNSVEEFLDATLDLRSADPFRTNLVGSVATSILEGHRTYDDYFWWIVTGDHDEVVGFMMRTPPHGLVLSPMPQDAIPDCVEAILEADPDLPGVNGPKALVLAFVSIYQSNLPTSREISIERGELLYALGALSLPTVSGYLRPAQESDTDLMLHWYRAFGNEVGLPMHSLEQSVHSGIARQGIHIWINDDQPVSIAGFATPVVSPAGTVARIGPVYTPPEFRSNGYASAATAALSQLLRNLPAQVMLFTDAANPTSNGIYIKLGYELLDENLEVEFR